jgi:very-short-patch-repair endonuclease
MTDAERKLWSRLRGSQTGFYFRRQTPIGDYVVDFVCLKERFIVEVDGGQHHTDQGRRKDKRRETFLRSRGFRLVRFSNIDVLKNEDGVLEKIVEELGNPLSSPQEGDKR